MMKSIIIVLALIVSSLLISCSDNTISPSGASSNGFINDRVENWNSGNQKVNASICIPGSTATVSVGNGEIYPGGAFSIQFGIPGDSYLLSINNLFSDGVKSNLRYNPMDTKYAVLILSILDANGNKTGLIERRNYQEELSDNSFYTDYVYFNSDVTVTGTKLNEYTTDTTFTEYSVSLKSGWSPLACVFTKLTQTYTAYKITNTEPSGGKWYYYDLNDKVNQSKNRYKHTF
jgi:hypothetical protein